MSDSKINAGPAEDATSYYVKSNLGPETYDQIYARLYPATIEFYVESVRTFGGPVLELGCGTGLVTWAIAESGHDIIGADLSKAMLEVARAKSVTHDPKVVERVHFCRANMVDFQLGDTIQTVIIPGRSFQHLMTPREQRSALTCIHRHLRTGGALVMNQFDPKLDYCLPGAKPPVAVNEVVDPDSGWTVRRRFLARSTDPHTQTFSEQIQLELLDGLGAVVSREETEWSLRWTYEQEMRYLFELTGFAVEALYSDCDRSGPAYAKEQIWICRKV